MPTKEELQKRYPLKSKVTVLSRYMGSGHYAPDEWQGDWYVVGYSGAPAHGYNDLRIAKHPDDDYAGIVHLQRIKDAPEASWRNGR